MKKGFCCAFSLFILLASVSGCGPKTETAKTDVKLEDATENFSSDEKNLEMENLSLVKGSSTILPAFCEDTEISYCSDIPLIATVDADGKVVAENMGNTFITARAKKGDTEYEKKYQIHVSYKDLKDLPKASSVQFAQVRSTWKDSLLGKNNDMSNARVKDIVLEQNEKAKKIWQSMKRDGTYLWEELPKKKKGSEYSKDPMASRGMYQNLEAMSRAYALPGGELYENPELLDDIKYGLDWLYTNAYHPDMAEYANWWQWEIGMPKQLNNICVLLYDDLGSELVKKYTDAIYYFQPDPFLSGACGQTAHAQGCRLSRAANRADVSITAMLLGALREDSEQLVMAKDAAETLLNDYVEPDENGTLPDGFYRDGSFIQHGHIPYVGTYGEVFLTGVLNVAQNLRGTKWELSEQKMSILGEFAVNSFAPFIYKGAAMDMTRGRAISREKLSDRDSGHMLIGDFMRLAESLPASDSETAENLRSMSKTWIAEDTLSPYLDTCSDLQLLGMAKEICDDDNIPVKPAGPMHHNFAIQDRMVHRTDSYAIGLSMFSNRINNFEYMNGENKHGWHTSDGMYYLYNNDLEQYSCDYWNTVNPYRLPGTTVDTISLEIEDLEPNGYNYDEICSDEAWVGGTSLKNFGCNGMALSGKLHTNKIFKPDGTCEESEPAKTGFESLRAKKSYFAFDDEFIVLNAGVNSTDDHTIISTVENRKLESESQELLIDGKAYSEALNVESSIADAKWALLKAGSEENNIGYYFPGKQRIYVEKESREGCFKDINKNGSDKKVSKTYAEIWFDCCDIV